MIRTYFLPKIYMKQSLEKHGVKDCPVEEPVYSFDDEFEFDALKHLFYDESRQAVTDTLGNSIPL